MVRHEPVLLAEVISSLALAPGDVVLDATLGGGGHTLAILNRIMPSGQIIGIDADPAALERASGILAGYGDRVITAHANFRELAIVMERAGVAALDAAFFDLGVSSFQLDEPGRGFSLRHDAPLDMRMDPRLAMTAADIVNRYREKELADLIYTFGEERYSRAIARAIVAARERAPILTTGQLAAVIRDRVGRRYRKQRIDPATRTFQAIRIVVNDELGAIEAALRTVFDTLAPGGRIAVIAFHSLEDRIIKNTFREWAREGRVRLVTKKPIRPTEAECAANPRARSARLRAAEKV